MPPFLHKVSSLAKLWFTISLPLVIWDIGFCLLRPHTFAGGKWHSPFYTPYGLYQEVDGIYGVAAYYDGLGFCSAQAVMNIFEVILSFMYLRRASQGDASAVLFGFAATSLTTAKTILYFLNEAFSGWKHVSHNDWRSLIMLYILPNGAWIVVPSILTYYLARDITRSLHYAASQDVKPRLKGL